MNPPKPLVKCKCGITYEGKQCPGCGTKNPNKTTTIKIANSQQVNTEDKGNTSPSPPPRKKRQPTEGGCVGDSLTPADTNSQIVQETSQ